MPAPSPSPLASDDAPRAGTRGERVLLAGLLAAALVWRLAAVFAARVDSDELQHLHVAWAYGQGLAPYREVFDNHMPLFAAAMAPFVAAVGETSAIVPLARLAMLPLFLATLVATWRLGRALFDRRTAAWGTVLAALTHEFASTSLETRPDDLWMAAWVAALATAVGGPWSRRRGLATGGLVALATLASVKTALLVVTLVGAAILLWLVVPGVRRAWPVRRGVGAAVTLGLPVLAALAGLAGLLAARGVLADFVRCVFVHGVVPGSTSPTEAFADVAVLVVGLAVLSIVARGLARAASFPGDRARASFVLLAAAVFTLVRTTVWIASARQDSLPVLPVAALAAAALVGVVVRRLETRVASPTRRRVVGPALFCVVALGSLARLVWNTPPWRDETVEVRAYLEDVLAWTAPGERVLDPKGQSVFRRRATYLVYERFTRDRLARALLDDPAPADVVATGTTFAALAAGKYGSETQRFVRVHFLAAGRVRVAGRLLEATAADGVEQVVDLAVPARYVVVREDGRAFEGTVDGARYVGPLPLVAGTHRLRATGPAGGRTAVVAAPAVERGFSPFVPPSDDRTLRGW